MPADNRSQYQGLLLPDVRLRTSKSLWSAESSFGQQSPQPGRPTPQQDTEALLLASGQQTATQEVDILCVDGGPVGRTEDAAQVVWKKATDGANSYRGREIPVTMSGWELIGEKTGTGYRHADIVALKVEAYAGRCVIVAEDQATNDIVIFRRATDGTVTGPQVIHDASATDKLALIPCLVEAGDRLFCLFWCQGQGGSGIVTDYHIRVMMSLDGGTTWTVVREQATSLTGIRKTVSFGSQTDTYEPRDMSAAFVNGQVVVCAFLWRGDTAGVHTYAQFASSNLSLFLELVNFDTNADYLGGKVLEHAGQFVHVYLSGGLTGRVTVAVSGSAYDVLIPGTEIPIDLGAKFASSPSRCDRRNIDAVSDDLGLLYILGVPMSFGTTNNDKVFQLLAYISDDDAKTFKPVGIDRFTTTADPAPLWSAGYTLSAHNNDLFIQNYRGVYQGGRLVLAHQFHTSTSNLDESLCLAYFGGYSDLTTAPVTMQRAYRLRQAWDYTTVPIQRAQDSTMYSATSSGTVSNILTGGHELLRSGDGSSAGALAVQAIFGPVTAGDELLCATFAAKGKNTGASNSSPTSAFTFRVDDGARGVEVGLYLTATSFGIYDRVTSAQLALVSPLPDAIRDFRLAVHLNEAGTVRRCQIWYRSWDTAEDRQWVNAGTFSLTDDGGTLGFCRVAFGAFTSTTQPADVELYHGPHFTVGNKNQTTCVAGCETTWDEWVTASNPDELSGTPLSTEPFDVAEGLKLRSIDGPAFKGDTWVLRPSFAFPVERVFPSYARSSRVRWRSVDDTTQQKIAVAFDPTLLGTDESHPGAPLYGLWLDGINWRTGELQAYAGGAWTKVADIDASAAFGVLAYTREGATVLPNAVADHKMAGQELVGWDWRPFTGGIVRRIKGNRGGRWATGAAAGPRVRVHVDKVASTDPTAGSCYLSSRSVCVVFDHLAADTASGWRVVIDAQDTVEGFFEIGTMTLGPVWVSGQVPDWGRVIDQQLGTAYAVRQDGTATGVRQSPAGYAVDIAWAAGVDTRQFHNATQEPTYIQTSQAAGVEGAATWAATVYDLKHELDALGELPLVYLPKLDGNVVSGVRTLTRWFELFPARVPDGLSITSAYGDEGTDETFTVATVTLEPEL